MSAPLKHKPMAFCDPNTVAADDVILYRSLNTPYGGIASRLKFNPKHECAHSRRASVTMRNAAIHHAHAAAQAATTHRLKRNPRGPQVVLLPRHDHR